VTLLLAPIPALAAALSTTQPIAAVASIAASRIGCARADAGGESAQSAAAVTGIRPRRGEDREGEERSHGDQQVSRRPPRIDADRSQVRSGIACRIDDQQSAAPRCHHRRAVAPEIGCGERPLLLLGRRELDSPGVGGDFERGRPEGEQDREQRRHPQVGVGRGERHRRQGREGAELREHDPAAPFAPEAREAGNVVPVQKRRPEELERGQELHPGEEADDDQADLMRLEPERQHGREHVEGKTGGKAEQHIEGLSADPLGYRGRRHGGHLSREAVQEIGRERRHHNSIGGGPAKLDRPAGSVNAGLLHGRHV
jgi:hypothetical protein